MTVAELIAALQEMPQDMRVVTLNREDEYVEVEEPEFITLDPGDSNVPAGRYVIV